MSQETLKVLEEKGYTVQFCEDNLDYVLAHGERKALVDISENEVNLMMFDDFRNPFRPDDFETTEEYADAIIERLNNLWEEYTEDDTGIMGRILI